MRIRYYLVPTAAQGMNALLSFLYTLLTSDMSARWKPRGLIRP